MSLILEALKKSEQQRRLGEAPTFGTPAPLARRRRTLLPVLAVMIVAALGIVVPSLRRDRAKLVSALSVAAQGIRRTLAQAPVG